jgi:phosphoribosylformylglycinamidine (FGAM) synthase-like amidotransferase family enzyme
MDDIAGIASADGLVLGLMDHPERAPDEPGTLDILANGVQAARS